MAADYPAPLIIPPLSLPHKQTFVLLHGRGSSGEEFGPTLLDTPFTCVSRLQPDFNNTTSLAETFPHARFVFPTAARRRATIYRRSLTQQWFDNWKLDPPAAEREELQIPGLHETVLYLHDLLKHEIALVPDGAASIVFGGLSQGCAASLVALLLWQGDPFGGFIGMCGWLPFRQRLEEEMEASAVSQEDDFFDRDEAEEPIFDPAERATRWLRGQIDLPAISSTTPLLAFKQVPLFFGHGVLDDRVSVILGRDASKLLSKVGLSVFWNEYEELGHWYSRDMLRDIVAFLENNVQLS
ncbi:Alpha/Beta hydrolase protein [Stachybotrys elegans]|uniref:Alpha/Beta hydrolase protein n=1 Tax=Stachybotrys elegans TaxID=80388 RepID=A0A8K0SEE3_9HYPO|nr:Alpha/Beta hydrolase protein [Stachybotrys elegans]